ncbi:MAG TPA: SpoIIE family protein phosphatase [Thermoleophilaceae bacterium]
MADEQNMGIRRRLATAVAFALLGAAIVPAFALSDTSSGSGSGLLGGAAPAVTVPTASVPTPTVPILPPGNPVQQVVNTVGTTVNNTVNQVAQTVNNLPTGGGSGGGGGNPGSGGSGSGGSGSGSSGSGGHVASTGGINFSSGGNTSSPSRGGSSKAKSNSSPSGESGGGAAAGPNGSGAGGGTSAAGILAAADTRATRDAATAPAGHKHNDSVLTRTVHDIVHTLPGWLKPLLVALALAIVALGANSFFHTRRARKLARLRDELVEEVGVLQAALLPDVPERLGGLALSVAYSPAEGPAAGGDFYDVFQLREDRVGILIGDISGHGKRALEHTSLLRYTLRAYLDAGLEPRAAIGVAGQTLEDDLGGDFATVVLAVYDSEAGTLTYSTAGHPPPIALGAGRFEPVTACSAPPIGVNTRTGIRQTTVTLPRGTDLCLFTDGVVEARKNGEMFGRDRLTSVLDELRPQPRALDVLQRVSKEIDQSSDDMAVCVVSVETKRAVPAMRLEELELQKSEVDGPHARRFLEDCGVSEGRIDEALAALRTTAGEFGAGVLRVRMDTSDTVVTVASPPGTTTQLPVLQGERLAAPIDL